MQESHVADRGEEARRLRDSETGRNTEPSILAELLNGLEHRVGYFFRTGGQ